MNPYKRHIKKLCKSLDVQWIKLKFTRKGMEYRPLWESSVYHYGTNVFIQTPDLPDNSPSLQPDFAVALHELGHHAENLTLSLSEQNLFSQKIIASKNYSAYLSKFLIEKEFIAWRYAQQLAPKLWSPHHSKIRSQILSNWIEIYNDQHQRKLSLKKLSRHFFSSPTTPFPNSNLTKSCKKSL